MKNEELINLQGGYDSSECTRECQDLNCDVTWNATDRCKVTCGTTNCSFVAATEKT